MGLVGHLGNGAEYPLAVVADHPVDDTSCPSVVSADAGVEAFVLTHATSSRFVLLEQACASDGPAAILQKAHFALISVIDALICVNARGSPQPPADSRVHIRDPSFVNLQSLAPMAEGSLLADSIASIAMLDPIIGGVDR